MSLDMPSIVVEGVHYATGAERNRVRASIGMVLGSLQTQLGDVRRRVHELLASDDSSDEKFAAVASYGDQVLSRDLRARLMGALGLAVVGGVIWNLGGALAAIVALLLFVAAGVLVVSVVKSGLALLETQWKNV